MAQVCRSWLFCRRRLVAWVHFWYGRYFLLAYWGRGCLLAWIFTDWIIFSMSSSKSFNSSMEGGFLVDLKPYVSLVNEVVSGWERSGLSSAFCVKTSRSFRWVVEDSRCVMVKEYSWLSSWCWIFPLQIIVECSTSLNLEWVQSVNFWLS